MHVHALQTVAPNSRASAHRRPLHRAHRPIDDASSSSSSSSSRLNRHAFVRASSSSSRQNDDEDDAEPFLVPANLFPGFSTPEKKAANSLITLMTMAATRVVLDQWCGTRHRSPMYNKLIDYMQKGSPHTHMKPRPIRDGNRWLHELMRHPEVDFRLAAVRILETRKLLADTEFNWEVMDENAKEGIRAETVELNKAYLTRLCGDVNDVNDGGEKRDACEDVEYERDDDDHARERKE